MVVNRQRTEYAGGAGSGTLSAPSYLQRRKLFVAKKMGSFRGPDSLHNLYKSEVNSRDPERLLEPDP